MKKGFKFYLIIWAALLVLFNVIAFVSPVWDGLEKFSASFWIGYSLITVAFLGQLACGFLALKDGGASKTFLKISLWSTSLIGLVVTFIVGGICMLLPFIPWEISVIVSAIVLVINIIAVVKATVAVDVVAEVDATLKAKTFFIKSLTVDADRVLATAAAEDMRVIAREVYEAIRYSDPMSSEALAAVEGQITLKFAAFESAVTAGDAAAAKSASGELLILLRDRNNKCKLLK